MQKRRMEPIEVSISQAGHIRLAQDESVIARDGEQIIVIHPAQLDTVIQWMQEVKEEILKSDYEDCEEA